MARRKITVKSRLKSGQVIRYKSPDRGAPGRTPKRKRWFQPTVHTGWNKGDAAMVRRRRALMSHKGDMLAAARSLQALANVTTDRETKQRARSDALYWFTEYKRGKR